MDAAPEPPAVARQRVRRALRKAREATPLSQGEVARQLGWSLSKMQRIEGGDVAVSVTDLRALLDVYGVDDPEQVRRLSEDARAARRQRYVTAPEYREHLTPGLRSLIQFEQQALAIRAYQPVSYPGLLQTPEVAETILAFWDDNLTDEARRVRYDVRMARRRSVVEAAKGPDYFLILDESVIKRRLRDARTTAEQLEYIAQVAQLPRVRIRIVPLAKGPYMPALGAFEIVDLSLDEDEAVMYRETYLSDQVIDDAAEVSFHRSAFERFWKESQSEEATLRAITAEAALLRSSLDYD